LISAVSAILPGPSTVFPSSLGPQLAEKMSTLKFSKYQLNLSEQNVNIIFFSITSNLLTNSLSQSCTYNNRLAIP
jgi:hypothetical protein